MDLWAFDDLEPADENAPAAPEPAEPGVLAPRPIDNLKVRQLKENATPKSTGNQDSIKTNVSKARPKTQASGPAQGASKPGKDFDDLDNWDDNEPAPVVVIPEKMPEPPKPSAPVFEKISPVPAPSAAPQTNDADEFAPVVPANAKPISLRPHLSLSKVERIGLVALLVLLLIGGLGLVVSLNRLPSEADRAKANDFPIKGQHIQIAAAETYWRVPKTSDTVRRGTAFIPVVRLTTGEGGAAIRVFFRNPEKESIGDAVTRSVQGGQTLEISATAGFEDDGMFAAYRTGQSKPWIIDVYEAPSVNSANNAYKKLFEMNVAPDLKSSSK